MKILLINSDLAKNRGDRAITEGGIELIKGRFPDAVITGLSEHKLRDEEWFGINFLEMDAQSLNPLDMLKLMIAAKKSDMVLWGGGELLKDYTNKAALWYWVIKMSLMRIANKNLFGFYQGIGPTRAASSKKLIAYVVNRCILFITRDHESYDKLTKWGVSENKLLSASDPAVIPKTEHIPPRLKIKLKNSNIDEKFFDDFICIAPRRWFHYKKSGILPYKYRKLLLGAKKKEESRDFLKYQNQLVSIINKLSSENKNILLLPMHMQEDVDFCLKLKDSVDEGDNVKILSEDIYSPSEIRQILSKANLMIGFRLHSNIIATSANTPSINYYYVDKGRVYFEQIGMQEFCHPIEDLLKETTPKQLVEEINNIAQRRSTIKINLSKKLQSLEQNISSTFKRIDVEK